MFIKIDVSNQILSFADFIISEIYCLGTVAVYSDASQFTACDIL